MSEAVWFGLAHIILLRNVYIFIYESSYIFLLLHSTPAHLGRRIAAASEALRSVEDRDEQRGVEGGGRVRLEAEGVGQRCARGEHLLRPDLLVADRIEQHDAPRR